MKFLQGITLPNILSSLLKTNGSGNIISAVEGTDYLNGASNKLPVYYSFGGAGVSNVVNDACPWLYVDYVSTVVRLTLSCVTAPTGNFQITIKRSSDNGSTFPDIIATVTVSSGSRIASTTTIALNTLNTSDILRCDIISVNGANTWTARLTTLSRNQ